MINLFKVHSIKDKEGEIFAVIYKYQQLIVFLAMKEKKMKISGRVVEIFAMHKSVTDEL
jgi:hypothetical protein